MLLESPIDPLAAYSQQLPDGIWIFPSFLLAPLHRRDLSVL